MEVGCIIMLFGLLSVNTLQFQRIKSGDTWGSQTCHNGTYVVRQYRAVDCIHQMKQADCNWNFDSPDPNLIGFLPTEALNTITFKVRLLEKNRPSTDVTCANHSAGNIAVQNVIGNISVWDTDIGNDFIRETLTYQFNQTDGTVKIAFTKHWDGFLIKLFINCLDKTGRNIAAHSTTRCVMVKYKGNVKYPIIGLSPLQTTSSTFFTETASNKILGTETTITPAPTTTAASTTEATKALAPTPTYISTASTKATIPPSPRATTKASATTATTTKTTLSPQTTTIPKLSSTSTKTSLSPTSKANLTMPPISTKQMGSSNAIQNDDEKDDSLVIIIGTVGGVVLLILIIIVVLLIIRKRNRKRKYPQKEKNENVGTGNEDNNNISNPTYHADSDVYLSQTNKDQIDGKEETKDNEMPEYAVVNKSKRCSVEEVSINDCAEDETKNPYNEGKLYSAPVDKEEAYFHNNEDLYDEAICVSTPPKVVLDEYAVVNKPKKDTAENPYSFT